MTREARTTRGGLAADESHGSRILASVAVACALLAGCGSEGAGESGEPSEVEGQVDVAESNSPDETARDVDELSSSASEVGQTKAPYTQSIHAYVWSGNEGASSTTYAANGVYSLNPTGKDIIVSRRKRGRYTVTFKELGHSDLSGMQVVAYGENANRCKIEKAGYRDTSPTTRDWLMDVVCHASNGDTADSKFVAQYDCPVLWSFDAPSAYTFSCETEDECTPWRQFSSAGQKLTVKRTDLGKYTVTARGLNGLGGNVQVTAWGDNPSHCKVVSWGGAPLSVKIACYDTYGSAIDEHWIMSFDSKVTSPIGVGAHVLASDSTSAVYTPSTQVSYNLDPYLRPSTNEAGRIDTGWYFIRHRGQFNGYSSAHVTAYGSGASYCKLDRWFAEGADTIVRTRCFSGTGSPTNTRYTELYKYFYYTPI